MAIKKHHLIIILLAVSIASHFAYFGHPNETVFDEVHFGKFISGYFTHEYFFDIHPPLGKLLISGMGAITGFEPGFSFGQIGDKFPDNKYLWLRLLPSIAGTLLPLVLFLLALELGLSRWAAFMLGLLTALENAMIAQSRFILLDSFLLLFGFTALYCYFRWRNLFGKGGPAKSPDGDRGASRSKWYLLSAGLSAGLAMSVKWTGVSFLAIVVLFELFHLWQDRNGTAKRRLHAVILCLIVTPLIVYTATFVVHLGLLSKTGPGDAFMTPQFKKTLTNSLDSTDPAIKPLNTFQKVIELNSEMYRANAGLTAGHPYASKWYTWPFMQRPIYYWYQSNALGDPGNPAIGQQLIPKESRIYFMGNPLIWWLSTLAIVYLILDQVGEFWRKRKLQLLPTLIILGYIINMLPFVGISRAMFLYHYLIGYIFALSALVYLVSGFKHAKKAFAFLLLLSIAGFLFFTPLTYGLPMSAKTYELRNWLSSWK